MEFANYLSQNEAEKFEKIDFDFSNKDLLEKKAIILTSTFLGVFDIDRFVLGDKVFGVVKGITFVSILVSIFSLLFVITAKVYEVYGFATWQSRTITWADNVAVIGQGMANAMYSLIGLLVGYIAFVIVDGFLCYYKNMELNYKLLASQINMWVIAKNKK